MAIVDVRKLQQSIQGFKPTLPPMGTMVAQPPQMPMQPSSPQIVPLTRQQQLQKALEPFMAQQKLQQQNVRAAEDQYQQNAMDFGNLQHKPALNQSQAGIAAGIAALAALFGGKNGHIGQQAFANYEQGMQNKENQDFDNQGRKLQAMLQQSQFGLNRADQALQGTTGQIQGLQEKQDKYEAIDYAERLADENRNIQRGWETDDRDFKRKTTQEDQQTQFGHDEKMVGVKADSDAQAETRKWSNQINYLMTHDRGNGKGPMTLEEASAMVLAEMQKPLLQNEQITASTKNTLAQTERTTQDTQQKAELFPITKRGEELANVAKERGITLTEKQIEKYGIENAALPQILGAKLANETADSVMKQYKVTGDITKAQYKAYDEQGKRSLGVYTKLRTKIADLRAKGEPGPELESIIAPLAAEMEVQRRNVGYFNQMAATKMQEMEDAKKKVGNFQSPSFKEGASCAPGVDCSKFVQDTFKAKGISLPRTTGGLKNFGQEVYSGKGLSPENLKALRPGDIILFDTLGARDPNGDGVGHTGIYQGNGIFKHASGGKKGYKYKTSALTGKYAAMVRTVRRVI